MITHFEVSNFKSIKHLGLDLRKFMVFVGPNGAGKTNLVRALEVFGEVLHRGTVEPIQEHGYDQLIRREKRPARSGLRFTIRSELPSTIVEDALRFLSVLENWKKPIAISGPVHLDISIDVTGSVHADEVTVSREELTLRSPKGTLEIVWNGNQGTASIGNDPMLWFVAHSDLPFYLPKTHALELSSPEAAKTVKEIISTQFFPVLESQSIRSFCILSTGSDSLRE
ncbi:AAA family ATPase [Cystobacter fuscus]